MAEKQLISDMGSQESQDPGLSTTVLQDKKAELELLRSNKLSGQMIQSLLNWLQQGEKPSKYLSALESKNFVGKTIKKVMLENGKTITGQEEIVHELQKYYSSLFESKDRFLDDVKLNDLKINNNKNTSNTDIGHPLTVQELEPIF